jgi:hypothetical protein
MTRTFLTSLLASVALIGSAAFSYAATEGPDFAAIADQLSTSAPAAAPEVKDIDFSKVQPDTYAYVASIERSVDEARLPFSKLAQQFIWGTDRLQKKGVNAKTSADSRGPNRPFIMVGGFWDTQLSESAGGRLTLICYVSDPDGPADVQGVELYMGEDHTNVFLQDDGNSGDFSAGDGVFGLQMDFTAGQVPAGQYLLELVATDQSGNESDMWPYLTIN